MNQLTEMKNAVLATALGMCKMGNFSTSELKDRLVADYPAYHWRHNTGVVHVQGLVDELVKEGNLICTEGVFCDPTAKLVTKTVLGNVPTTRQHPVVVKKKRGPYNTKAKKAAAALAAKATQGTLELVDTNAPATLPAVVTHHAVTTMVKPAGIKMRRRKYGKLGKEDAANRITNCTNGYARVLYTKKGDGEMREMIFRILKGAVPSKTGNLKVIDMHIYNEARVEYGTKSASEAKAIRTIPLGNVHELSIEGKHWRVGTKPKATK